MDLYEHMGKDLFRAHGIPTPAGRVCGPNLTCNQNNLCL